MAVTLIYIRRLKKGIGFVCSAHQLRSAPSRTKHGLSLKSYVPVRLLLGRKNHLKPLFQGTVDENILN
ncbi:MAG: hypothetical protein ACI93R_004107 [Flavobacteriales bacterium]|jgi:hypothetical protein